MSLTHARLQAARLSVVPGVLSCAVGYALPTIATALGRISPWLGITVVFALLLVVPLLLLAATRRAGAARGVLNVLASSTSLPTQSPMAIVAMGLWAVSAVAGFGLGIGWAAHRLQPHAAAWMIAILVLAALGAQQSLQIRRSATLPAADKRAS